MRRTGPGPNSEGVMGRRGFMKSGAALAVSGLLPTISCGRGNRPNVLFVSLDDLNDWVGCLGGYPKVHTPNIDRLARRGVLFTNAHCASPLCNPSRTSVLTGLRPSTSGVYGNNHWWRPALPDAVSLPQLFRRNGYHAAGAGKNFHHTAGFNPPDQWDEYRDLVFDDPWDRPSAAYPWIPETPRPVRIPLNKLKDPIRHELDWGNLGIEEQQYGDSQSADWAAAFLGRKLAKPFFLSVGFFHPHLPWYAPGRYFENYPSEAVTLPEVPEDDLDDIPAEGRKMAAANREHLERIQKAGLWKEAVQAYLANISFADTLLGRVLDALDGGPNASDTIVMLWSDHGWHLGEKKHWYKSTLWERATRVPLIVAGPGVEAAGRRCSRPVSLVDLYPTLVDLCGLQESPNVDGASLRPLLRDPDAARERPAITTYLRGNHAVRTERWRYIRYRDGGEELYDHQQDPNEWTNLAGRPEHAALKSDLARWLPSGDAPEIPEKKDYDFDFKSYTWSRKGKA